MNNTTIKADQLKLGDRVDLLGLGEGYTTCTVVEITEDEVSLFRPYTHVANFSYGGHDGSQRVIPYVGVEQFRIPKTSQVKLIYRYTPEIK